MNTRRAGLGMGTGAALCVGAVLGPGVLALPASAAATAGPASVLAWLGLVGLSLPVAMVFAALGARHPDGGGVATFVRRAFGPTAAAPVGWWFYWAVPLGVPAAALIGGEYTAVATGGGRPAALAVAALVMAVAFAANLSGLRMSGRLQLLVVGLLAALLLVTVVVGAGQVEPGHFTPFLPRGWTSVGTAASVLFFAFAGWEAISHLSGEFAAPRRDLPRVTLLAWSVVSGLYLGLAVVTMGVLGTGAGTTSTPLTLLLERGIGPYARATAAVAALLLTFGAVNAYLAGGARLGAALGRDGQLPRQLADGASADGVPRCSLGLLAAACAVVTLLWAVGTVDLDVLLGATSACLASVTLAGTLAAAVLLPRHGAMRLGAILSSALIAVVLVFCGPLLLVPVLIGVAAYAHRVVSGRRMNPVGTHAGTHGEDTSRANRR
ncbi:APC family permease [Streptomyces litchfieldiae]|uniref:Amino acid permease n=1 Tax=Streptomyces litchfieldiae TaxID=3075543 RepID=A0ABU2MS12_9ACTN|nr:amino acid permease [Streptomyces sp. DSM 44938]MDT0344405.1 amino acid permease [Streptomyces sp. DSM 44938]